MAHADHDHGGQSIFRFFSSQELRDFFEDWFGNELGLPTPLLMTFLAKGTEFVCGIFVGLGIFTRISASLLAFVMLVATLTANLDHKGAERFIQPDGVVTISALLFACLLIFSGAGEYSFDNLLFRRKVKFI
jgi:putative oxidoreductase